MIVALLDRGIDWRNNDFRNTDGTTRIKYIFDITDDAGAFAPGNTYGIGTVYTEAQINAALTGGPNFATRDAVGHGTTTAGIPTVNGRQSAVSAAAPIVTGTIALMLQMNPKLNSTAVKSVLQSSARADAFTGAVPNNIWGYGKLDAFAALDKLDLRVTSMSKSASDINFQFKSVTGLTYRAEYKADLAVAGWTPLVSNIDGTSSDVPVTDIGGAAQPQRFYRVVVQ